MSSIKCPMCHAVCVQGSTTCMICGGLLPLEEVVQQVGDVGGQSVFRPVTPNPSAGFGGVPKGFGAAPAGFGGAPVGFGGASHGFGGSPQQVGFGSESTGQEGFSGGQGGFNQASNVKGFTGAENAAETPFESVPDTDGLVSDSILGYAENTNFTAPPVYEAKALNTVDIGGADLARFAEDVAAKETVADSVYWGLKECIFFLLKSVIPVYGLIIGIMCLIGNPRKYPKVLTNYMRASLSMGILATLILTILMLVLGASAFSTLTSIGG